ncbi:MAG: hypothetical protein JWO69_1825 [Thermoleophilia bacterium]|jgi:flagellar basal body-associated protein FliL|nr:hypothetical protein [Thermoleophilia bacterium]
MTKFKLPIIILVVLIAAFAGLKVSGVIGGKAEGPLKKHVVEPVAFAEPFVLNTTDAERDVYVSFNLAMQLAPLDEAHWLLWSGAGGGGHGGPAEAPGPPKLAAYTKYRDAVIYVASSFDGATLRTEKGKGELKRQLLEEFAAIAEADEAAAKAGADTHEVGPPYHVQDVVFTNFVVS